MENQALESQANGHYEKFQKIANSVYHDKVKRSNHDDRIRNVGDSAVMGVENRMYDANLTAMNNVVFPQVETAVRLITAL